MNRPVQPVFFPMNRLREMLRDYSAIFAIALASCSPLTLRSVVAQDSSGKPPAVVRIIPVDDADHPAEKSPPSASWSLIQAFAAPTSNEAHPLRAFAVGFQEPENSPPPPAQSSEFVDEVFDKAKTFDQKTKSNLDDLQRKVQSLLNQQLSKRLESTAESKKTSNAAGPVETPTRTGEEPAANSANSANKDPSELNPQAADAVSDQLAERKADDDYVTQIVPTSAEHMKRVLDKPVDRLALADNLFRSSELEMALQIYQQLDRLGPASDDQAWIKYQIANCNRRLGKLDEAKKDFRELANSGVEDFPVPQARWWLDAIDRHAELESRSQRFEEILNSIQEKSKK